MENLIRKRLVETPELVEILAKFGEEPAIFYQKSPEDIQWQKQIQYPKIIFAIDKFSNAERGTYGALTFEIVCSETSTSPEEVEILIRRSLEGIFFTPQIGETFSAKWRDTSLMQEQISDKENLIFGALVNFDIYEYPAIKTSDPDPIAALNDYALNWYENFFVIGESELPPFLEPTRERPAIYFSRKNFRSNRQRNSDVQIDGTIQVHLFAPTLKDRIEWLTEFFYSLLLDGEVTLLDDSPMFVLELRQDFSADEIRGQISIDVTFGILRKPEYAHVLLDANFSTSSEGKFSVEEIFDNDSTEKIRDFHKKINQASAVSEKKSDESNRKIFDLHKKISESYETHGKNNFDSDVGGDFSNVHNRRNYSGDEKIVRDEIHKCACQSRAKKF